MTSRTRVILLAAVITLLVLTLLAQLSPWIAGAAVLHPWLGLIALGFAPLAVACRRETVPGAICAIGIILACWPAMVSAWLPRASAPADDETINLSWTDATAIRAEGYADFIAATRDDRIVICRSSVELLGELTSQGGFQQIFRQDLDDGNVCCVAQRIGGTAWQAEALTERAWMITGRLALDDQSARLVIPMLPGAGDPNALQTRRVATEALLAQLKPGDCVVSLGNWDAAAIDWWRVQRAADAGQPAGAVPASWPAWSRQPAAVGALLIAAGPPWVLEPVDAGNVAGVRVMRTAVGLRQ